VATSAPHTDNRLPRRAPRNPIPAPRDRGGWEGTPLPRPPSFNSADVEGKPPLVTERDRFDADEIERMERLWVSQLESLGAVDRLVAGVVRELRRAGELENTIVIFTSDHGFLRGQHRFDSGKSLIYEESILVPLLARGPGFPSGERFGAPVANVDLGPTILRAAGAKPLVPTDGVPLQRTVGGGSDRDGILVEIRGRRGGDVVGVRTDRWILVRYDDGFEELYDLREDPHQLENLADDPASAEVRERLEARIEELRDCSAAECRS
jgi:N-acetylglucosamine-6-sulfatase